MQQMGWASVSTKGYELPAMAEVHAALELVGKDRKWQF